MSVIDNMRKTSLISHISLKGTCRGVAHVHAMTNANSSLLFKKPIRSDVTPVGNIPMKIENSNNANWKL